MLPQTYGTELTQHVAKLRSAGEHGRADAVERAVAAPETIPPAPLTHPRTFGRHGRRAVYARHQKATTGFMVSSELKKFIDDRRLPSDDSIEDTIRRLVGMEPRTML